MTKSEERVRKCEQRVLEAARVWARGEGHGLSDAVSALEEAKASGVPDLSEWAADSHELDLIDMGAATTLRALVKSGSCNAETALEWAEELEER